MNCKMYVTHLLCFYDVMQYLVKAQDRMLSNITESILTIENVRTEFSILINK